MGMALMLLIIVPLMIFAPQLTALFNAEAEVVAFGTLFIRLCSPFYVAFAVNQVYSGALRGAGDTRPTMFIMLGSFVVFRQLYLFVASRFGAGPGVIALGYPVGWMLCSALLLVYYYRGKWMKKINLQEME